MFGKFLLTAIISTLPNTSIACISGHSQDLQNIPDANVVLVANVFNYEVVKSRIFGSSQYARLSVFTKEVLYGDAPEMFEFIWVQNTYSLPENFDTRSSYIFALKTFDTTLVPKLAGDSVRNFNQELTSLALIQKACSDAFIFETGSDVSRAIRQIFDGEGDPEVEAGVFSKYFHMDGTSGLY